MAGCTYQEVEGLAECLVGQNISSSEKSAGPQKTSFTLGEENGWLALVTEFELWSLFAVTDIHGQWCRDKTSWDMIQFVILTKQNNCMLSLDGGNMLQVNRTSFEICKISVHHWGSPAARQTNQIYLHLLDKFLMGKTCFIILKKREYSLRHYKITTSLIRTFVIDYAHYSSMISFSLTQFA